jgi:hypothetical protein
MSVTGGWMLYINGCFGRPCYWEGEYCLVPGTRYQCTGVPVHLYIIPVYTCTCNLLSTCMYVHTGTVHVVQERMDILPYMCVPYTGVRWGGWGAGGENQKKWYPGTTHFSIHYSISIFQQAHNIGQHAKANSR